MYVQFEYFFHGVMCIYHIYVIRSPMSYLAPWVIGEYVIALLPHK